MVPATLGGGVAVGSDVVAIGNPLGLRDSTTTGIVSGLNRTTKTKAGPLSGLIQFDAAVNPGSSGGPLLNTQGLVVGVVVSIADPGRDDAFAGIGFAVPIGAALGGDSGRGRAGARGCEASGRAGFDRACPELAEGPVLSCQGSAHMRSTTIEGDAMTPNPLEPVLFEVKRTIVGQDVLLERMAIAMLAGGHLLVEGVPGLAKTLAVKSLAGAIGGEFQRIQFTPDLVPADLVGTRVYHQRSGEFEVSLGPVFTNLLLADEINRAPAKVQSALLEVMQERQVTIGRETFPVPEPFLVMATQNPIESDGTYPLPEAQVDRFMMKVARGLSDLAGGARDRRAGSAAARSAAGDADPGGPDPDAGAASSRSTSTPRSSTTPYGSSRPPGRREGSAQATWSGT